MVAISESWGVDPQGETVTRVHLSGGGLSASMLTWGALVQDLRLEGHPHPLVLGYDVFDHYPVHSPYFGAVAGRFANRIANGRCAIDGTQHQLDTNFLGKHTLHGGKQGIGKRNWQIADLGTSHVTFTLTDPAGMMGFPGTCEHVCSYTLKDDATLHIALTSTCDAATIVNLAPHSYFSLDGGDMRDHTLRIDADQYLPVDDKLIPTGEIVNVEETGFDFRTRRRIGAHENGVYDHNFCLANERRPLRDVAWLREEANGLSMIVATTEPGLQVYTGSKLNTPVPGLAGKPYDAFSGIALEPQLWPDSPNHETFPDCVLRPGEQSRQISTFRFERG
ncbi:MAG: galactose mutarotase [Ahrensia sp.]|nr:galactose mutarotase [Ahrensia sp.]